ncbi:MAG: hypothetical protein KA792_02800 [Bacteroidales bacterium]|nr:hypothetical protein [Bacteroidales bacterium]
MVEKIVFTSKISDDVNSQNISDVWVYIDDDIIGAFELPAKIPILKEGKHKLTLRPGIKLNGIDATRAIYSLYSSLDSNIILEPDKILKVNFNTTYVSNLNITWQEDFENPNFSLVKTERSDTTVKQAKNENYSYFEYGEKYAGRVYINTDKPYFELVCDTSLTLPRNYKPVYLEMDYKTSCDFTVSLKITTTSQSYMQEYLTITAAPYWRKIYINLTPYANLDSKAKSYKLYFSHRLETGKTYDELFFDNLKLVTTK